jgi:DinB superfamily
VHSTLSTITADTGLTPDEITRASRHLSVTRGFLLESVSGLSAAQWAFKSAEDVWSIAENLEHIVLVESAINGIIEGLGDGPEQPPAEKRSEMDEFILNDIPRRSRKGKSPASAVPTGRWSGPEALQHFVDCRGKSDRLLVTRRLRGPVFPHPMFGPWDGYQWLLAGASHGARHTAQIRELKANPNFPH